MTHQETIDNFILRSEATIKTHNKDEAFQIISAEIDTCEDKFIYDYITVLSFVRHEKALDWIERNRYRITNVGMNWGHLAASSFFNWERAHKWLGEGRPLSLIALDALFFCTTVGDRQNQSPWMRQIQPKLIDKPRPQTVAETLQDYLRTDNVPRTKNAVQKIIANIFDVRQ